MSGFKKMYKDIENLDPYKRVNYVEGLVLGADEFKQEELYLLGKDRIHNRSLHGYGTVCGLNLSVADSVAGPEVKVEPGLAVNPRGEEIRVPEAQCAMLNEWLNRYKDKVEAAISVSQPQMELYVTLCYKDCFTDDVPIPSKPCMSLEDSSVPSRIADYFELKFATEEEIALSIEDEKVGELIALLGSIEISDDPGDFLAREQLEGMVRNIHPTTSPPHVSPFLTSSPHQMRIHSYDARDFINAAFRVWVTEVRPRLLEAGRNCVAGPPDEGCVTLARLQFGVEKVDSMFRVSGNVTIDEERRPYLLHSRLLQEYLDSCFLRSSMTGTIVSAPGGAVDESGLVHLSGDEVITGEKTFTAPLKLNGDGRVEKKHIIVPAMATPLGKVSDAVFQKYSPALHFEQNGAEASFSIPVPVDRDLSEALRIRLMWAFQFKPEATMADFKIKWQLRSRFASEGHKISDRSNSFRLKEAVMDISREEESKLIFTDYNELLAVVEDVDQYGLLRLKLETESAVDDLVNIYLLQVDMAYTSNAIGGGLPS